MVTFFSNTPLKKTRFLKIKNFYKIQTTSFKRFCGKKKEGKKWEKKAVQLQSVTNQEEKEVGISLSQPDPYNVYQTLHRVKIASAHIFH